MQSVTVKMSDMHCKHFVLGVVCLQDYPIVWFLCFFVLALSKIMRVAWYCFSQLLFLLILLFT